MATRQQNRARFRPRLTALAPAKFSVRLSFRDAHYCVLACRAFRFLRFSFRKSSNYPFGDYSNSSIFFYGRVKHFGNRLTRFRFYIRFYVWLFIMSFWVFDFFFWPWNSSKIRSNGLRLLNTSRMDKVQTSWEFQTVSTVFEPNMKPMNFKFFAGPFH